MKLFNKIKSLFKRNSNIQEFTIIRDSPLAGCLNDYNHFISQSLQGAGDLHLNLFYDINHICKLIDKHKDNINILNKIGEYINTNKKKFSLVHLKFMCEYLRDKIKECNKKSIFNYE